MKRKRFVNKLHEELVVRSVKNLGKLVCNYKKGKRTQIEKFYLSKKDIKELGEKYKSELEKRIYNPVTKTYYGVKDKSSKVRKSGKVRGLWKWIYLNFIIQILKRYLGKDLNP